MPQSMLARSVLVACLVLAGILLGALGWRLTGDGDGPLGATGTAAIGGPFSLVDQNGVRRSEADFRGQLMLVFFGYTYCPDICPTELQRMTEAMDALGDAASKVTPIFISIDPERDTVAQMKEYAANFHPRLVALTGTAEEVAQAARAYRVYYAKGTPQPGKPGDYLMDHSGFVYLMGADGRYITHFRPDATPQQLAETLRGYLS